MRSRAISSAIPAISIPALPIRTPAPAAFIPASTACRAAGPVPHDGRGNRAQGVRPPSLPPASVRPERPPAPHPLRSRPPPANPSSTVTEAISPGSMPSSDRPRTPFTRISGPGPFFRLRSTESGTSPDSAPPESRPVSPVRSPYLSGKTYAVSAKAPRASPAGAAATAPGLRPSATTSCATSW